MPTQTSSVSSAKIALAVSFLFVAGAAAFAAAALPGNARGYNTLYVVCADKSSLQIQPGRMLINGKSFERETTCKSDEEWRAHAADFCRGKVSPGGSSTRMLRLQVTGSCRIPLLPPVQNYGYGYNPIPPVNYGYGYNPPPVNGYGYNAIIHSGPRYDSLTVLPSEVTLAKDSEIEFRVMSGEALTRMVPVSNALWLVGEVGTIVSQQNERMVFRANKTKGRHSISVYYLNPDGNVVSTQVQLNIE